MPGRRFVSGVRSGRFKYANGTAGAFIVPKVKSSALHRIYNGGENGFDVELCLPNGNPVNPRLNYPVGKSCSVDLQVPANRTLKIIKANVQQDVEGVYESLDAQKDVRSGRFKVAAVALATTTKVIVGVSGKIYRVLNSGTTAFTVTGGVNVPVPQNGSVDVFVDNGDFSVTSLANQAIQGVYDRVTRDADIRSGRFRSTVNVRVIDFSASVGQGTRTYRIYNSGTNIFSVVGESFSLGDVAPSNSIDIEVSPANQMIEIQTANAALIEGVYEFLGSAN